MRRFKLKFSLLLVVFWAVAIFSPLAGAAEIDDILGGFDDEEVSAAGPDLEDDVLDGFAEEPEIMTPAAKSATKMPPWLAVSGGLSLSSSYNFAHESPAAGQTDQRGGSRLRTALDIDADISLAKNWQARIAGKGFYDAIYFLKGRDEYSNEVLDEYEDEFEFTEIYLQGAILANLDLKTGRQIVVWGKSDNIRVTDVLNPLDNREPGVVDIRDLRLPVAMTKIDFYHDAWNYSAMVIHENRFNKNPVYGNDFYPGVSPAPPEEKPATGLKNQEYALAVNGIFSGWDLSFYGASLFDDQAHLDGTPAGPILRHSKINMFGSAINVARGSWLLKGEAAWLSGIEYSIAVGGKERLDILFGAEFNGISETVFSFELVDRHIFSFDDRLKMAPVYGVEDEWQYVLRVSRDYYNDTLQLTALLSFFGADAGDGAMQRFSGQYDWSDDVAITFGAAIYQDGDKAAFRNIGDNDRLFTEIRYSF